MELIFCTALEHDASLSRNDYYLGNDHSFDATIWNQTASHFVNDTISFTQAAVARLTRIATAYSENPQFNMTPSEHTSSYFETAYYMSVFGNLTTGNAVTEFVEIMFSKSACLPAYLLPSLSILLYSVPIKEQQL